MVIRQRTLMKTTMTTIRVAVANIARTSSRGLLRSHSLGVSIGAERKIKGQTRGCVAPNDYGDGNIESTLPTGCLAQNA
jgi:hypothetical protein